MKLKEITVELSNCGIQSHSQTQSSFELSVLIGCNHSGEILNVIKPDVQFLAHQQVSENKN